MDRSSQRNALHAVVWSPDDSSLRNRYLISKLTILIAISDSVPCIDKNYFMEIDALNLNSIFLNKKISKKFAYKHISLHI